MPQPLAGTHDHELVVVAAGALEGTDDHAESERIEELHAVEVENHPIRTSVLRLGQCLAQLACRRHVDGPDRRDDHDGAVIVAFDPQRLQGVLRRAATKCLPTERYSVRRPWPSERLTDPRDILDLVTAGHDDRVVHRQRLPARAADAVALPASLPELLRQRLKLRGITSLWRHQAEAFEHARAGRHVVIATGTASGKSLAYQLPVLERLLADERATALYLAPTKALAHDQLRAMRELRLPQLRAAVVDGDTPAGDRDAIRRTANLLLTNPDLVHHTILGDQRRWGDLLHRLAFVIVDEAHVARGVFGGHVALVLRRLRRAADRLGATPTWLFATATIGNPAEHARALSGLEVVAVERDAAPRGPTEIVSWLPPMDEDGRRASTLREASQLLASFVGAGAQTLVFARSRKAAEIIAIDARARLGDARGADGSLLANRVAAYRAGYLADERRALEAQLRNGELVGIAATDALELGIDVAGLDVVVLAGWPGTTASFWQRIGRAGRSAGASAAVLVAQADPLDHYVVTHPDDLYGRRPEDAAIDPANPHLLAGHLRCACSESPMGEDEATRWFGDTAPGLLASDVTDGVLRLRGGRHYWTSRTRASAQMDLRTAGGATIQIVDAATGAVIGDVDEARAHRHVHDGAIYLHQGRQLKVTSLDLDRRVALAEAAPDLALATRARVDTDLRVVSTTRRRSWHPAAIGFGAVRVTTQVTGYDVFRPGSDEILDRVPLDLPAVDLDTAAVWWILPAAVLEGAGLSPRQTPGALHAAEHAAIAMLPLIALCDRWDLGGLSTPSHVDTGEATVFIYDGHPGGAGLTERSYDRIVEHLELTRTTIADCSCRDGCPSCVHSPKCGNGNEPLDKRGAVALLDALLSTAGD